MWEELCINGYRFNTPDEYKEAKKEEEAIRYIKLKTDFKNYDNALKLYNTLIEKKTLHTVIGIDFLHELNIYLTKQKRGDNIQPIPLNDIRIANNPKPAVNDDDTVKVQKLNNIINLYKSKNKNNKIVIFFLIVLLIGLFVLTFTGDNSPLIDDEMRLQDKYAAWEEELTQREEALKQQESSLQP